MTRDISTRTLTVTIILALGECPSKTDYETMQPEFKPVVLVSVSMGVEGEDSGSGAVEAMVKSEVKKSIVV